MPLVLKFLPVVLINKVTGNREPFWLKVQEDQSEHMSADPVYKEILLIMCQSLACAVLGTDEVGLCEVVHLDPLSTNERTWFMEKLLDRKRAGHSIRYSILDLSDHQFQEL